MSERILGMVILSVQIALYSTTLVAMKADKGKYSKATYVLGFISIALIAFVNVAVAVWAIGMIMG